MDQRTLVVSCVEYYSDLKNIPSNKVFISFQQSGFIDLILDSHKTFPEMDIDFFVGMIDGLTYLRAGEGIYPSRKPCRCRRRGGCTAAEKAQNE